MTEENKVPVWARELAEAIADTVEFKGQASIDCRQSGPEETEWGVDLVELWPAVMDIQEAGPNDGEFVFGIVDRFDILAAQKIFEEVNALRFEIEDTGEPKITLEGKYKGREVVIILYFEPDVDVDEDEDSE